MTNRMSSVLEREMVSLAKSGDVDAQQQLLLAHEPFLRCIAGGAVRNFKGVEYDDLLMAARYGMLHAIQKFDFNMVSAKTGKPVQFLSYAGYWIKQYVQLEAERSCFIWVPAYGRERNKSSRRRPFQYQEYADRARRVLSIEAVADLDKGKSWDLPDDSRPVLYDQDEIDKMYKVLDILDDKARTVIEGRFLEGKTMRQVGNRLGITSEAVRQIQIKAIRLLRKAWDKMSEQYVGAT